MNEPLLYVWHPKFRALGILLVGMVMCAQAVEHVEAVFSNLSIAVCKKGWHDG